MFITMILIAISDNIKGVLIPTFKEDFSIDNSSIGYMITIGYIGYISFTYIGRLLCEKIDQKKVFLLGLGICIITLFLFSQISSYTMLLTCMFLLNVGIALLSISINTLVPIVAMSFQAIIMNTTHFCYGLGSTVGQYTTGSLLENGVNWRSIYLVIAVLFALAFIGFIFVKTPQAHIKKGNNKVNLSRTFKNKMVYFYVLALGFYCFAKSGTSNWLVNFTQENYGFSYKQSSTYLSIFFATLTIGRLLGGFVVEKRDT